jgi:serine/threonine protein kinase
MSRLDDEYGVGDEIGDYTLTKEIGNGAFSKVFEAVTPIAPFFLQNQQDSSATLPYNLPNDQQINGVLYTVAVKVVLKTSSADDDDYPSEPNHRPSKGGNSKRENELDYLRQIDRETAIWSRLHHPFLLEMNEVIRLKDATIIISELASGGTLLSYIQKIGSPGLSENVCKHFYKQIADALSYLHLTVGIIHHDVKLENVLLTHDLQVKMCDFGFAVEVVEGRARDHEPNCPGLCCAVRNNLLVGGGLGEMISLSLQQPNSVANEKEGHTATGSLHYLAPEHLMPQTFVTKKEEGPMGEKGDIWAFGCILYAMITGTLPFCESFLPRLQISIVNGAYDHDRLDKVGVSSDVKLLIENMLQKDWKIRYNIRDCIQSSWVRSKY